MSFSVALPVRVFAVAMPASLVPAIEARNFSVAYVPEWTIDEPVPVRVVSWVDTP